MDKNKENRKDHRSTDNDHEFQEKQKGLSFLVTLLRRYLKGSASEKERQAVDLWEMQSGWENMKEMDKDEMDAAFYRVRDQINRELQFGKRRAPFLRRLPSSTRYAAVGVLFVLLASGLLYITQRYPAFQNDRLTAEAHTRFETTDRQTERITLPDGTTIHLNRGSKLHYRTHAFNKELREIWLEGEAFFDVAKDPGKPFIVHSGGIRTAVRGTSFNIKAYPQLDENVVSVKTGKVEISDRNVVLAMLTPNRQIIYDTTDESVSINDVREADIAAWTDGRLVFDNAGIRELELRLKQFFGAEVQTDGKLLDTVRINAVFYADTTLDEVMQTIGGLYGFRYEITSSGNVILRNLND